MYKYIIILFSMLLSINAQDKKTFDHSAFDKLLKEYVSEGGLVNYEKFIGNEGFERYLKCLSNTNLDNYSESEKLAFYINAYNAFTIKNILNHWPLASPLDVDGFFKKYKFNIAGSELSLDEIEHERTAQFAPVLMHFGLVCAAKSCPKLVQFAYTPENVYHELKENAKLFLNDPSKNSLDKIEKVLYLSDIFKWFRSTFEEKFGTLKNTVSNFMSNSDKEFLLNNEMEIIFNKYNWEINKQ